LDLTYIYIAMALVFGLYMAWSIGANDVANAMGTSVGSGALTLKQAVIVAATLEFAGAYLVGAHVTDTVRKKIIDPQDFPPELYILGMLAALLASAVWLQLASYKGWPVSTTHTIVGAIVGFGIGSAGAGAIDWSKLIEIVASWVVSPLLAGTLSFAVFFLIRALIYNAKDQVKATQRWAPVFVFLVFAVVTLVLLFKGLKNLDLDVSLTGSLLLAAGAGLVTALAGSFLVRRAAPKAAERERPPLRQPPEVLEGLDAAIARLHEASKAAVGRLSHKLDAVADQLETLLGQARVEREQSPQGSRYIERIFGWLQIISASFVAFAHGANDVANAVGPVAGVVAALRSGVIAAKAAVPPWVLALGGVGIVIGLATWGWRVIETVGKKITELTPTRGFAAEFAAATTIVLASKLGWPVSTTHTLVGAVLGVGLARGMGSLNLRAVRDIAISWIVTIPAGAVGTLVFYHLFRLIFGV